MIRQRWSPFGIGLGGTQVVRVVVAAVLRSIWTRYTICAVQARQEMSDGAEDGSAR